MHYALFFFFFLGGLSTGIATNAKKPCGLLNEMTVLRQLHPMPSQILMVKVLDGFKAEIQGCEYLNDAWQEVGRAAIPAVIGKHGLAQAGSKHEGDLKTPAGLYPIGEVFGSKPLAVKMDYKYITAEDKFIDDRKSKQYNTWVRGATQAKSFETMLIEPYTYGAVINYNMNPTVPGAGSAIFLHLWRTANSPTAGCVALAKQPLLELIHWFDKAAHPYVYIYTTLNSSRNTSP